MCGIAGIYDFKIGRDIDLNCLTLMVKLLHHRGPDGTGFKILDSIGLAHSRLSIIDLETGQQPIHNEDKSIWTVFNGEIFNYIELREELIAKGHSFYTKSDTEVIVHLYEEYGDEFVTRLNGQFAISLYDTRNKRLLLIRDRAGILPLFYLQDNSKLYFGSEIKALLAGLQRTPDINFDALDQIFTFWSPISPQTIFKNVFEVSPGHMLMVDHNGIKNIKYWDWDFPADTHYVSGDEDVLANELKELLIDSTRIRLRADVPVGAYLSGGLDSSVLTALIHHYGDVPLRTFSIGFDDDSLDESRYQDLMNQHIKTEHSHIICYRHDIANNFIKTIWNTETPILRTAPVPMSLLSGLVRKNGYKVVLTGEGSDEVFGGYDIFKETKIRQFWARNPASSFRPALLKRLYPYLDLTKSQTLTYLKSFFGEGLDQPDSIYFSHIPRWSTTAKCKEFFSSDLKNKLTTDAIDGILASLPTATKNWHFFNRAQYIEAKSLMAGYLLSSQGDRMLMSNSVEGRFPFLDHRVIEFANKLHPNIKMKVLNEKYLLKHTMKRYLPDSIINRSKQPYRAPDIPSFFTTPAPEYVSELLSEDTIRKYNYFDPRKVSLLCKKIKQGRAIGYKDNMALVGILSTQIWHYLFIENYIDNILSPQAQESSSYRSNIGGA
jgi:asparagine synthase (glutamine-hydrolysing)